MDTRPRPARTRRQDLTGLYWLRTTTPTRLVKVQYPDQLAEPTLVGADCHPEGAEEATSPMVAREGTENATHTPGNGIGQRKTGHDQSSRRHR